MDESDIDESHLKFFKKINQTNNIPADSFFESVGMFFVFKEEKF